MLLLELHSLHADKQWIQCDDKSLLGLWPDMLKQMSSLENRKTVLFNATHADQYMKQFILYGL